MRLINQLASDRPASTFPGASDNGSSDAKRCGWRHGRRRRVAARNRWRLRAGPAWAQARPACRGDRLDPPLRATAATTWPRCRGWSSRLPTTTLITGANGAATAAGRRCRSTNPCSASGTALATSLIQLGWGRRYQDLGRCALVGGRKGRPASAWRWAIRGFGWTIEYAGAGHRSWPAHLRVAGVCRTIPARRPLQNLGTVAGGRFGRACHLSTPALAFLRPTAAAETGFVQSRSESFLKWNVLPPSPAFHSRLPPGPPHHSAAC